MSVPNLTEGNVKKLESIENDCICFSKVRELNDPFELLAGYGKTRKDPDYKKLKNAVEILSLSRKENDLLMWSHYAGQHKGYCLVYEVIDDSYEYSG